MLRPILSQILKPILRPLFRGVAGFRWAYNFDGVDDRGQLQFRAINPDGDIDIEFKTGPEVPPAGCCIIDQSFTNNFAQKEFYLQLNTGRQIQPVVGGSFLSSNTNTVIEPNTTYRVTLLGNQLRYYKNGVQTQLITVTRGSFREPSAVTKVGAWSSNTSYGGFYRGHLYDIRINGTLWPLADRDQPIQLPSPSGLGAELITQSVLENPFAKGSQWTYLGAGRWQYVGDGSLNDIAFISVTNQPIAAFLEFEVESVSGSMVCSISASAIPSSFNSVGVKRYYYTTKDHNGVTNANCFVFKRQSGVASCIIKNISFKPLGTCNPMTLVNTTSDRWQEVNQ